MQRRSSRGNPNHDERGRFCSADRCRIRSERTPEEYEERTKERMGVTVAGKYYSKATANDPPTPKQKRFAEAIAKKLGKELPEETKKGYSEFIAENVNEFYGQKPEKPEKPKKKKPTKPKVEKPKPKVVKNVAVREVPLMPMDISHGKDGANEFTRRCAEAFGANMEGVQFNSKAMGRCQGKVGARVRDGKYEAAFCIVTSKRDKKMQAHNTYHEVFHLARNGREVGDLQTLRRTTVMEETMAEVSASTMCEKNGFNAGSIAYSEEIITVLPRLKQSEKYSGCKTMSDFGEIFIADRRSGGECSLEKEYDMVKKARMKEGEYFSQYKESARKELDFVFVGITEPSDRKDKFVRLLIDKAFDDGFQALSEGKRINQLSRNDRIVVTTCIRRAMEKEGIL